MTTLSSKAEAKQSESQKKPAGGKKAQSSPQKVRLATAWLGGCSGCHMSFLTWTNG